MRATLAAVSAIAAVASAAPAASVAESLANGMTVKLGVVTNFPDTVKCDELGADWALCGLGQLNLTYKGTPVEATNKNWSIYMHSIRRVLQFNSTELKIEHVTGDLHKITPTANFAGVKDGANMSIPFVYEYWKVFDTDFMPRWWVYAEDNKTAIIPNTDSANDTTQYVMPIVDNRRTKDQPLPPANTTTRFQANKDTAVLRPEEFARAIIPTPLSTKATNGTASLAGGLAIEATGLTAPMVDAAKQHFEALGVKTAGSYKVTVKVDCATLPPMASKPEGYTLNVTASAATVQGCDEAGAFYGLQSLASLVTVGKNDIATVEVVDAPRFSNRGMMLDVARNFHKQDAVFRLLDQMAAYKLNKFHFHLSDDEGWRLEIGGLPELTEVGAKRCHDPTETTCLLPQLGSGPTSANQGSGHFTRQAYIDIVKYAAARGIEVYPEFDMPGHSRAAVMSMEARYKKLAAAGDEKGASEFRLLDPEDTSTLLTVQYYDRHSQLNPCMPSTLAFVGKVISEVVAMHKEAGQPLQRWHFGGDEAHNILLGGGYANASLPAENKTGKGWVDQSNQTEPYVNSPVCQKFIAEKNITVPDLIGYLAVEVSKLLVASDVQHFMAWQDGMKRINASALATQNATLNFWDALFWGGAEAFTSYQPRGYKIVLSNPDYLYFDFPQENNPAERGYYWAGRHQTVRRLFTFVPQNLPQNAELSLDRDGAVFQSNTSALPANTTVEDMILGMQGQLFCETVRTDEQMEYMLYPRLLALAERAWHKASWELDYTVGRVFNASSSSYTDKAALLKDWTLFANVLGQRELPKLDAAKLQYRITVPGALIKDGLVLTNTELPGVPVHVSADGKTFTAINGNNATLPANAEAIYVKAMGGRRNGRVDMVTKAASDNASKPTGSAAPVLSANFLAVAVAALVAALNL